MTVAEYAAWRRDKVAHFLLDVRQPEEFEVAKLEGAVLIPLAELPGRLAALPKDLPVVVMREAGIDALNLSGGIDAWSREIDPKIPLY